MCIHDIVSNRLCESLIFHTRSRSYAVVQKLVRIVPDDGPAKAFCPGGGGQNANAGRGDKGFVTRLTVQRTKMPLGVAKEAARAQSGLQQHLEPRRQDAKGRARGKGKCLC